MWAREGNVAAPWLFSVLSVGSSLGLSPASSILAFVCAPVFSPCPPVLHRRSVSFCVVLLVLGLLVILHSVHKLAAALAGKQAAFVHANHHGRCSAIVQNDMGRLSVILYNDMQGDVSQSVE